MKNQSQIDHRQIAALLTQSAQQLDDDIVSALGEKRAIAMQKQRVREPVFSLSAIGHRAHNLLPHSTHQWVAAAIVLVSIISGAAVFWSNMQDRQNPDMAILTGDMPLDAFVDK